MGWRRGAEYSALSPRQWEDNFQHKLHVGYAHLRHGSELELHWRWYSSKSTEPYWARRRTTELPGFSYQAMSNADLAVCLCSHGGSHPWFRATWLGDLARLHCNNRLDRTDALVQARTMGGAACVSLQLLRSAEAYELQRADTTRSPKTEDCCLSDWCYTLCATLGTAWGIPILRLRYSRAAWSVRTRPSSWRAAQRRSQDPPARSATSDSSDSAGTARADRCARRPAPENLAV